MQRLWGSLTTIIGLLMFLGGFTKTEFILYRLLAARSRLLWGNNVHSFYMVVGLMVAVFGILIALGYSSTRES